MECQLPQSLFTKSENGTEKLAMYIHEDQPGTMTVSDLINIGAK